jgi:hypothetical protein
MSKEKQSRSDPLALEQFFSTFLLLGSGILLAIILLLLERLYCRCHRPINKLLRFKEEPSTRAAVVRGCCSLLSRVRQTTAYSDVRRSEIYLQQREVTVGGCLIMLFNCVQSDGEIQS